MAWACTTAGDELVDSSYSVPPGATGTFAMWFKPNWAFNDSAAHMLWRFGVSTASPRLFDFTKWTDNNCYIGWYQVTDDDRLATAATSAMFTNGTWQHFAFTWSDSADTEELFVGGSSAATRTAALVTGAFTPNEFVLGNNFPGAAAALSNGDLMEFGHWDKILSQGDITALAKGCSPLMIQSQALVGYVPMIGRYSPEIDRVTGDVFTVTATQAAHGRIIYPHRRGIRRFTTAVAGVAAAWRGTRRFMGFTPRYM